MLDKEKAAVRACDCVEALDPGRSPMGQRCLRFCDCPGAARFKFAGAFEVCEDDVTRYGERDAWCFQGEEWEMEEMDGG
jgi:hypothetical protein